MLSDIYSTFAKEGGRVGSGALGSGQEGWRDVRDDRIAVGIPPSRPHPPRAVPETALAPQTKTCVMR